MGRFGDEQIERAVVVAIETSLRWVCQSEWGHVRGEGSMSNPPMSIGLPVYNGENYLGEAIESLRRQTFGDFELIISDNASTDATEDIARDAAGKDRRIRFYRQEVNAGGPANYNFVLDRAKSDDFFLWHAHDDLRAPESLERSLQVMKDSPQASVVFSRAALIGQTGEHLGVKPRPAGLLSGRPHRRLRAVVTSRHTDFVLFGLMRRHLLERTDRHGSFKGGDRVLVAEMALLGEFVEIDEFLFLNRDHPDRYTRMPSDQGMRQQKNAWWDPTSDGKISLPRWTGLARYLHAVRRHPLPRAEKARCYAAVGQALFDNRMYVSKQLIREVQQAVPAAVVRVSPHRR